VWWQIVGRRLPSEPVGLAFGVGMHSSSFVAGRMPDCLLVVVEMFS